jgi:hypothetical protein
VFLYPLSRDGLTRGYLAFGHSSSQALNKVAGLGVFFCTRDSRPLAQMGSLERYGETRVFELVHSSGRILKICESHSIPLEPLAPLS